LKSWHWAVIGVVGMLLLLCTCGTIVSAIAEDGEPDPAPARPVVVVPSSTTPSVAPSASPAATVAATSPPAAPTTAAPQPPAATGDGDDDGGSGGDVGGGPADKRDRYYGNCTEAKNAGAAPLRRGQDSGYRSALDRDGDGIACDK
jgi:hypothetical protein